MLVYQRVFQQITTMTVNMTMSMTMTMTIPCGFVGFKYSAHIYRNYSDALCHYVYMSRKLSYPLFLRIVLVKSSVGFVSSNFADSQTYYPEIYWHSIENPCRMWTLFEDDFVMEIPNELHHPPSRPLKLTGISWCFPPVQTLSTQGLLGGGTVATCHGHHSVIYVCCLKPHWFCGWNG